MPRASEPPQQGLLAFCPRRKDPSSSRAQQWCVCVPVPVLQAHHVDLILAMAVQGQLMAPHFPARFLQQPLLSLQEPFLISSPPPR